MPKRNLSIRKNKNKIPKKSKKQVIKNGVKGRGKIKSKTKVNKRFVKSKHLQRKHSKNKNEKKRKYSKKKKRLIGGMEVSRSSSERVAPGGIKLAQLQVMFNKLPNQFHMDLRGRQVNPKINVLNVVNNKNQNLNPQLEPQVEITSTALRQMAVGIKDEWIGIIDSITSQLESDLTAYRNTVSTPFPYLDANNMRMDFTEEYFVTVMRDLATKLWDSSTSSTSLTGGGGAVNLLRDIYNDEELRENLKEMFKGNMHGSINVKTTPAGDVFDLAYNYIRDGGDRYCYISSRIASNVTSLEHLFAFFDGLFVGVLVSEYLMDLASNCLGEDSDDFTAYKMLVLLLHPLAAKEPNERKSNQGLLHVDFKKNTAGYVTDIAFGLLSKDNFVIKTFGRTGTAGWWGLKEWDGSFKYIDSLGGGIVGKWDKKSYRKKKKGKGFMEDADGNKYPKILNGPVEVDYKLDQIYPDFEKTDNTRGGWWQKGDESPRNIRNNQNVFIQTVIATANELLNTYDNLKRFLICWQSHMAHHFSDPDFDLRKEIEDLERAAGSQIKSYCETTDCEKYISETLATLERAKPTPPTSFYQGPNEYPPDYNSGNTNTNSDWNGSGNENNDMNF